MSTILQNHSDDVTFSPFQPFQIQQCFPCGHWCVGCTESTRRVRMRCLKTLHVNDNTCTDGDMVLLFEAPEDKKPFQVLRAWARRLNERRTFSGLAPQQQLNPSFISMCSAPAVDRRRGLTSSCFVHIYLLFHHISKGEMKLCSLIIPGGFRAWMEITYRNKQKAA